MPVRISRPNPACGASSSGAAHLLGRSVHCKKCGTPFIASQDGSLTIDDSVPINGPVAPAIDIPNPFGKYRVLRKLGQGGMGAVYLAQDDALGRTVALKVPKVFDKVENADILEIAPARDHVP
jgi:serine/threonine protein kinase